MAIKLSQSLKQSQSLMMTPQLQQAIKLLTLTHLEMTNVIAEEMVENPVLEEFDIDDSKNREEDYNVERLEMQNKESSSDNMDESAFKTSHDEFDWSSYVDSFNSSSSAPPNMATRDLDDLPNYENIVSKGKSLAEHLEWQMAMEYFSEEDTKVALLIIHSINDDGYLATAFEEIIAESGRERQDVIDIREVIMRMDPVGCAAESLTECLLAQARIAEERSPLLEKIICNHLKDLQNRDFDKIAKVTGVSTNQIKDTAMLLQNFHPKPGRLVSNQDTHYVVPDIFVVQMGTEFVVRVNDEGVPRLRISNLYQEMLKQDNKEAKEYVQEKLRSAMWLIKSIQNRQRTIVKVAIAIVRQQQEFFKKGPKFLKPMVLKNIANEIGMHESTVSRVTTNKYMHTPIGTFELKYFFNSGVGGKNGGVDVSSEVLKLKIKELVKGENPKKPLSDQKIAELLSRDDVEVARRTVAKYREMMGILSSSKRKFKG
ncbi:MAG: RNA polymerase factor sigma-54 [Halobacteriovoraceae bacterium]|jgi:RNA polymerase sigma-54 factor|nr:RNA polymerase factor sigma-54 [Halobacteriovoraceae bacterium]MBT5094628.1 RNA polymerase factor sigma-54 [Halobacteriovoraceae bacterium]